MTCQAIHPENEAVDGRIYPDLPCFVANDAEFHVAVQKGIASARAGRFFTLNEVEAELQQIIHDLS